MILTLIHLDTEISNPDTPLANRFLYNVTFNYPNQVGCGTFFAFCYVITIPIVSMYLKSNPHSHNSWNRCH